MTTTAARTARKSKSFVSDTKVLHVHSVCYRYHFRNHKRVDERIRERTMSTQPTAPPAYNPSAPQNGSPAVGFEQYQQGSFQQPASQYPPPPPYQPYPQQQYSNPSVPPYSQPPMGGPTYPPNQTTIYTQQPRTVYVYDQRGKRRNDTSDEDCLMLALCGACLCCCLMD